MGELQDQGMHPVVVAPKVPGRFYIVFGKPIETRGTKFKKLTPFIHFNRHLRILKCL
jgi:hypothetical protein